MLMTLLNFLLVSNAVCLIREKSILYSRIVINSLLVASFLAFNNLFIISLEKGTGIYGGLFNVTASTQTFSLLSFSICAITPILNAFFNKEIFLKQHIYLEKLLITKFIYNKNLIYNKGSGQVAKIACVLIIVLTICGFAFLVSTGSFVQGFFCVYRDIYDLFIELTQSHLLWANTIILAVSISAFYYLKVHDIYIYKNYPKVYGWLLIILSSIIMITLLILIWHLIYIVCHLLNGLIEHSAKMNNGWQNNSSNSNHGGGANNSPNNNGAGPSNPNPGSNPNPVFDMNFLKRRKKKVDLEYNALSAQGKDEYDKQVDKLYNQGRSVSALHDKFIFEHKAHTVIDEALPRIARSWKDRTYRIDRIRRIPSNLKRSTDPAFISVVQEELKILNEINASRK